MDQRTEWSGWERRFRDALKDRKLRIENVAERMGRSASVVYAWTNGGRDINLKDFFALCKAADLPPMTILFGSENAKEFLEFMETWENASQLGRDLLLMAAAGARRHGKDQRGAGGVVSPE